MLQIAEPPPNLEVVVITASIKPSSKDKLNQGVELLDRNQALIGSVTGGIGEALDSKPGVRSSYYGPNASRPIIRGLGEDRIRLLTNFVQGVDASTISPDHAVAIDGLEAQSIEVLKGAAALRYGANAVGGLVNIIDGRLLDALPTKAISGDLFLGGSGAGNGRATSGKIKFKAGNFVIGFDGISKKSKDFRIPGFAQTNELREQTNDETFGKIPNSYGQNEIFGASLNYVLPNVHFGISARDENSEYGIPGEEAHIELSQKRYDFAGGVKTPFLINKVNLNGSFGKYSHGEYEATGEVGTLFKADGYEIRIEARHKPFMGFEGVFGVQNTDRDFEAIGEEAFILPVTTKNTGLFFSEIYEGANWGLEFGARSEKTEYSGIAGFRNINSTSGAFGGYFKPIKGLRFGLNYSSTERIPTETELFANGPHAATQSFEIGNPNLKTEIAKSLELSSRIQNQGWDIELNIWKAKFDNFIAFENTGETTGSTILGSAGIESDGEGLPIYQAVQKDAELKGFESHISKSLGTLFNLDAKIDFGLDLVRGEFFDGSNISRMPPMAYHLGFDLSDERNELRFELVHFDKQDRLGAFETITKAANVLNFSYGYKLPEIEGALLTFAVENIANAEVREHTSVLKDRLPKPDRNIVFGIAWKF